jgi:hypothetical protein
MNMHPRYRRRRRVAVAIAVTVAAVPFLLVNDPDADIPQCHAWQTRTQCETNK